MVVLDIIKNHFKEEMSLNWTGPVSDLMLRDMIRIFVCGIVVANKMNSMNEEVPHKLQFEWAVIIDKSWMPEDDWKWW